MITKPSRFPALAAGSTHPLRLSGTALALSLKAAARSRPRSGGFHSARTLATLLVAAGAIVLTSAPRAAGTEPPVAEAGPAGPYTETVTVTATRLPDRDEDAREVPASTTVISRDEIAASGARTVQEVLSRIAGAVVFDQIGNAIQTTFDLRGFTGGGLTILLDGARLNDPRNNGVPLETIGLEGVERIEVTRGPAAATVGGGSEAGVVNIVTRAGSRGARPEVTVATGTYDTRRLVLDVSGAVGGGGTQGQRGEAGAVDPGLTGGSRTAGSRRAGQSPSTGIDWLVTASRDRTDGFRENADARLNRYTAGIGYTFAPGSRLSLTVHAAEDTIGAPGALTSEEWRSDPGRSPFNLLDNSDVSYQQATANWRGASAGWFSFAANLSYLSRTSESLTTGRAAARSGGFLFDARVHTLSGAAQSSAVFRTGPWEHTLSFGAEGGTGISEADACGTLTARLSDCDPSSFYNSSNRTRRSDTAVFLQDSVHLARSFTLLAGVRWDRSRFDYREDEPDPLNDQSKTFSQSSWKGGATWNPSAAAGLYASYGESFLPPTVEDLFAFPTFGSNPDLEPTDARSIEAGFRGRIESPARREPSRKGAAGAAFARTLDYSLAVFRTDLTNEIVFQSSPLPPFGSSVNAGKSRREGAEVTAGARIVSWLAASFNYSRTRATFQNGPDAGNDVPLVPKDRFFSTLELTGPHGTGGRLELLRAGRQVLTNDESNGQQRLEAYTVVNARFSWRPFGTHRPPSVTSTGPTILRALDVFVEARNLLDETYATRGIYTNRIFVTPAPRRTIAAGLTITF